MSHNLAAIRFLSGEMGFLKIQAHTPFPFGDENSRRIGVIEEESGCSDYLMDYLENIQFQSLFNWKALSNGSGAMDFEILHLQKPVFQGLVNWW